MADLITLAEWQDEVERRGKLDCKFVCPACGNVASPNDWRAKLPGLDRPERAARECIGRIMPREETRRAFPPMFDDGDAEEALNPATLPGEQRKDPERPCDYAAFGLFNLCKIRVKFPGGKIVPVFEFAEVT